VSCKQFFLSSGSRVCVRVHVQSVLCEPCFKHEQLELAPNLFFTVCFLFTSKNVNDV